MLFTRSKYSFVILFHSKRVLIGMYKLICYKDEKAISIVKEINKMPNSKEPALLVGPIHELLLD